MADAKRSYGVYLRTHVPLSCAPAIPLAGINLSVDHTIGQLEDDSDMSEVLYSTWLILPSSEKDELFTTIPESVFPFSIYYYVHPPYARAATASACMILGHILSIRHGRPQLFYRPSRPIWKVKRAFQYKSGANMIMVDLVAQASMLGTFILTILVVKVCVGEGLSFDGCDGYMKLERDIFTRHTISVRDTHTFLREPFSEYRASVSKSPPEVAHDDALSRKIDSIIIGRLPSPPSRGSLGSNLDGYCLRKSYPTSD
ncbi:hypothetical protein BDV40DRAFT_294909 [Aspergillus tamarii]|uniref:Uncharacterized protein n=1 Tax=Aspergillus tamarii TaxID=41984 RepID=A0A5N6VBG8_ASPTM|nr:hypothetical protein BDV40DRAFT_294909 [Aspergillus tamarii]